MNNIEHFFQKATAFCAYQERCLSEVREKLYDWKVESEEADQIIEKLIDEKYVDEERFAKLYAGSKFRAKKWGKQKIKYMLKQKKIPSILITNGLQKESMKSNFDKAKLYNHLISKGYENDLVREVINELAK